MQLVFFSARAVNPDVHGGGLLDAHSAVEQVDRWVFISSWFEWGDGHLRRRLPPWMSPSGWAAAGWVLVPGGKHAAGPSQISFTALAAGIKRLFRVFCHRRQHGEDKTLVFLERLHKGITHFSSQWRRTILYCLFIIISNKTACKIQ